MLTESVFSNSRVDFPAVGTSPATLQATSGASGVSVRKSPESRRDVTRKLFAIQGHIIDKDLANSKNGRICFLS